MKKFLLLFTAIFMTVSMIAATYSGTCGANLSWSLDTGTKILTITGSGAMNDYSFSTSNLAPWYNYRESINSVSLPNGLTKIGNYAFYNCSFLRSVSIPNSVSVIGGRAFYNCNSLTSVNINDLLAWYQIDFANEFSNPLYMAHHLYRNNVEITTISIPANITQIKDYTFVGGSSITNITLPSTLTSIGASAFTDCASLTDITIPNTVTTIGNYAFAGCTGLTSVTIPNSVTSMGSYVFNVCTGLTSVTIGDGLTALPAAMFSNCSNLTSVSIGENITSISSTTFQNCTKVNKIVWNAKNYAVANANAAPFTVAGINTQIKEFIFGSAITTIPSYLCYAMTALNNLTIGNNITSVGSEAFGGCTTLTNVNWNAQNCTVSINTSNPSPFYGCSRLTTISLGNTIRKIPNHLLYNMVNISSVAIPNSVTDIGEAAFANCQGLTSITLPNTLSKIEKSVFQGCTGLRNISIPMSVQSIGESAFSGCRGLTTLILQNGLSRIETNAFVWYTSLASITIPNSVTHISTQAFGNCGTLTNLTIPSTVTYISTDAFRGTNLLSCTTSATQTTVTATVTSNGTITGCSEVGYKLNNNGAHYPSATTASGLTPNTAYSLTTYFKVNNNYCEVGTASTRTQVVDMDIHITRTPTTIEITFAPLCGDATLRMYGVDSYMAGNPTSDKVLITRLNPNTEYGFNCWVETVEGGRFTKSQTVRTTNLQFQTMPTRATSNTAAMLYAKTNLSDDETGAGFEWRRYDAPDLVPSTMSPCPVINGEMYGTLNGLSSNTYYKCRPYYVSSNGNLYYGDWTAFITADAYVYFSPMVSTSAPRNVQAHSATVSGSVVQGSDQILEQGFEYWTTGNTGNRIVRKVAGTPQTITATGQRMEVQLTDLQDNTEYTVRAYARTNTETTYGSSITFTTPIDLTPKTVIVVSANPSMGTVSGGGEYENHSMIIITAIPNEGCEFVRWSDGVTDNPREVEVNGDGTYTAEFKTIGTDIEETVQNGIVSVIDRTIICNVPFSIYTIAGQDVTGLNGRLESGVYIVRTQAESVKVIVPIQ